MLMIILRSFSMCRFWFSPQAVSVSFLLLATSALAQLPPAQMAALKEIDAYAEQLCTTVGTSGHVAQWKTSGEATAGLKGLTKLLADLGFKISLETSGQTTSGVLQADLGRILQEKGYCKLRVFLILNSTMLSPPQTPSEHQAPPKPLVTVVPGSATQSGVLQDGAPKDLGVLGFPNLKLGMTVQEFANKKPQAMGLKAEVDASGRTSVFYDGVQEHAQLGGLVDGLFTLEFRAPAAGGISVPGPLSSASYYSGSFYNFDAFQAEQTEFKGNPELNCADSMFESVIVKMIAKYGLPSSRQKEPELVHGVRLRIPNGVDNPCGTPGACTNGDDAKLNFRENVRWLRPGLYVNANRYLMGSTLYTNGAPIFVNMDCEIHVDIKTR